VEKKKEKMVDERGEIKIKCANGERRVENEM
jgi:hypothetical protein